MINERDEFEAWWAKLAGTHPCCKDENHRAIAQNAWLSARQWQREQDAEICDDFDMCDPRYIADAIAAAIREQGK